MGELYYDVETAPTKGEYLLGQVEAAPSATTYENRPTPADLKNALLTPQQDWRKQADCRDQHEIMFDHLGETKMMKLEREQLAKRICAGCRVLEQCLEQAITNNESGAVWGGLNDDERKKLKKNRRAS